jgi:hypothetical protein
LGRREVIFDCGNRFGVGVNEDTVARSLAKSLNPYLPRAAKEIEERRVWKAPPKDIKKGDLGAIKYRPGGVPRHGL